MSDISSQLIKDSYNYVLQSDLNTGVVYRIGGGVPINPIFQSGLTINSGLTFSNGSEQSGYVLTSDSFGNATWEPLSDPSSYNFLSLSGGTVTGDTTFTENVLVNTISATTYQNLPSLSGNYLPLSGGTVTGETIFTNGLISNSISATTYQNLPQDIFVTGGTYNNGTSTFTNNSGGTFNVTGLTTPFTGGTVTGDTTFTQNLFANTISATTYQNLPSFVNGSGVDGQVSFWSGTTLQGGSNNLFWDNQNKRLGIGTNTPNATLDVVGNTRMQGTLNLITTPNNTGILLSSYLLTGSNAQPLLDLSGTWNTTGTPTLIKANVTNTASNASSLLMDLQVGGSSQFRVTTSKPIARSGYGLNGIGGNDVTPVDPTNGNSTTSTTSGIRFGDNISSNIGYSYWFYSPQYTDRTPTSGDNGYVHISRGFAPTSGTATFNILLLRNTINQTGGANGITRGLYVNPTLTSAADWRSIEWSNNTGRGLYGSGSATNNIQGDIGLGLLTTPSAKLQVRGNGSTSATSALLVQNSTPSSLLEIKNNGQTLFNNGLVKIESDGNVGIGLATGVTPTCKLDVRNNVPGSIVHRVSGTDGTLFQVTDDLSGNILEANDISGINIFSVNSLGYTTHVSNKEFAVTGNTIVYQFPTSVGEVFKMMYSVKDGVNLRGGEYLCVQNGTNVNDVHTFPTEFGDTSGISFSFTISGGNIIVNAVITSGSWNIKLNVEVL